MPYFVGKERQTTKEKTKWIVFCCVFHAVVAFFDGRGRKLTFFPYFFPLPRCHRQTKKFGLFLGRYPIRRCPLCQPSTFSTCILFLFLSWLFSTLIYRGEMRNLEWRIQPDLGWPNGPGEVIKVSEASPNRPRSIKKISLANFLLHLLVNIPRSTAAAGCRSEGGFTSKVWLMPK